MLGKVLLNFVRGAVPIVWAPGFWYVPIKVNRKVQGMPQSQTAANPRHQEEEKKDKNICAQNKQTNVREAQRPAPSSPSEVIRMLKQTEKRGQRAREDF